MAAGGPKPQATGFAPSAGASPYLSLIVVGQVVLSTATKSPPTASFLSPGSQAALALDRPRSSHYKAACARPGSPFPRSPRHAVLLQTRPRLSPSGWHALA